MSQNIESLQKPESLTNDFFANLLCLGIIWKVTSEDGDEFEGHEWETDKLK